MTGEEALRRLARRLALGLCLDVWPTWAAGGLLLAGVATLIGRVFVPAASSLVPWLWLAPVLAVCPTFLICYRRFYSSADVVALADSLTGGSGTLIALFETGDTAWRESALAATASAVTLPRLRPWRRLAIVWPAAAFMAAAFWIPQRLPQGPSAPLANELASRLDATLAELKQEQLVTAAEEERLDEEIERIRQSAERRVDASSWEAVDALNDRIASGVAEKQNALQWADEALARYAAASKGAGAGDLGVAAAQVAELTKALERLEQHGLLRGASEDIQRLLKGAKLPTDAAELTALMASLSKHLRDANGRIAGLSQLGKLPGRFDPSEFPLAAEASARGGGRPGRGGVTRGRADADLTWGKETAPLDRFKDQPLPPGAPRSPDDWAPVAELPGEPDAAPVLTSPSAARQYAAVAGQSAWRRTLAPRHQSAVKKYFEQ
ncbi:MAG: hypothetical protein ABIT71_11450 [Vicinamibacteraceae bacterium]